MRRFVSFAFAAAVVAPLAACGDAPLPYELQGRVYDVRFVPLTTAADTALRNLPRGTFAVQSAAGSVTGATASLRLPPGSYQAVLIDEQSGQRGTPVTFQADAEGRATVALAGGPATATTLLVSTGDAATVEPFIWARFRNATTGVVSATGTLLLGHFAAEPAPFAYTVRGSGRLGIYEQGEFGSERFRLGGVLENLPVAPPGFTYVLWLFDTRTSSWARVGPLVDENGAVASGISRLPAIEERRELPRLFVDWTPPAGVDVRSFTHARLSLEREGSATAEASNVLFVGVFGNQFLLRRPEE
jgi:hypothetical protein